MVTQSIPASESQGRNPLGNPVGYVLQESLAPWLRRTAKIQVGNLRVQADLVEKLQSRVQDPDLCQARLLKVLPASVPIKLAGETDTDKLAEERDRAAQRARAEVTRSFRSLEDDNDKDVKRQWLGEPLATIPEEVAGEGASDMMTDDTAPSVHEEAIRERFNRITSKDPEELSSGSGRQKRMRTGRLRVSSVNALQKPSTRRDESIVESREVHIKHLLDIDAVKDWNNKDAIKTGAKILSG